MREAFAEGRDAGTGWSASARLRRVMIDAAYNLPAPGALARPWAEEFAFRRLVAVVGVMAEKDAHGILDALEPVVSSTSS